jgi:hypothetical protein
MTKDLAHDLDVGSAIDLSARVAVPKRMSADRFRFDTGQTSVVPNSVTDGPAGDRIMWHILPEEKAPYGSNERPFPT